MNRNVTHRKSSPFSWIIIYVLFPLVPFLLESILRFFIRIAFGCTLDMNIFNGTILSMSIGLFSFFVYQSLLNYQRPLNNEDERMDLYRVATSFLIIGIVSIAFFGIIVLIEELKNLACLPIAITNKALTIFKIILFIWCFVPIRLAGIVQRSYKLKAAI